MRLGVRVSGVVTERDSIATRFMGTATATGKRKTQLGNISTKRTKKRSVLRRNDEERGARAASVEVSDSSLRSFAGLVSPHGNIKCRCFSYDYGYGCGY